jgi:rRNA biogenesis protein RRP5
MRQEENLPASDISGSDNEDDAYSRKKSKRSKKREKREEEARIARKELSLLEGDSAPETSDDYERLILGSPNSSYLWIKYMAFHLQMTEIEKARHVAERALKTINFREPQEKLNIWVGFLNLENSYGSRESLLEVFERAVNYNEPKKVYIQMAQIYERTNKTDLALQLHQVMIKKFKTSSKIWTGYGSFLLKNEKPDDFRQLLQKCVKSLPKRKHVKTITAFAIMEFKHADAERGRTIFEGLLSNYPKRVDIWSIYLDQEIRTGDLERTR